MGQPPSCQDDNSIRAEVTLERIKLCLLGAIGLLPNFKNKKSLLIKKILLIIDKLRKIINLWFWPFQLHLMD